MEDEFLIRLTLSEAMADDGFDVTQVETGDAAAALLAEDDFALLVTDVQLPGKLDGLELVRTARRHAPTMPVIYMTGRPDNIDPDIGNPREAFIAKPYLPSEVCAMARRLLAAA